MYKRQDDIEAELKRIQEEEAAAKNIGSTLSNSGVLSRKDDLFHLEGNALTTGKADRVGLQTSGGLDLTHLTAQGLLDKGKGLLVPVSYTHLDVYKRQT